MQQRSGEHDDHEGRQGAEDRSLEGEAGQQPANEPAAPGACREERVAESPDKCPGELVTREWFSLDRSLGSCL